jgi:internalin A
VTLVARPAVPGYQPPDTSKFMHPLECESGGLRSYCEAVIRWHSSIRFVGISINDQWDCGIGELYVEPQTSSVRIPPELDLDHWPADVQPVLETVASASRLVLLGDPGTGKSTLVNWITFQLARKPDNPWKQKLGRLLPVPFILREGASGKDGGWEGVYTLSVALQLPQRVPAEVAQAMETGQAFLLLDGVDEIGDVQVRLDLRDAVLEAMAKYPKCRWLLTSRCVGYEEVPFDHVVVDGPMSSGDSVMRGDDLTAAAPCSSTLPIAELRYLAPFDDRRIDQFADNWFLRRVVPRERALRASQELVTAVRSSPATSPLARIPQLLTMIALIYRVRATLPNGRWLLYEQIAETYLKSLDAYRRLKVLDYPLDQKKRWLARVAFEMQLRRQSAEDEAGLVKTVQSDCLPTGDEVRAWIADAMNRSGFAGDPQTAGELVDYVSRRSGLLVPRGVDRSGQERYAFAHLSFQEYFAACFLRDHILSPLWSKGNTPEGVRKDRLRRYGRTSLWRETMLFLFEGLASLTGWPEELAEVLFGLEYEELGGSDEEAESAAILLAQVAVDPHSGFGIEMRRRAADVCCRWEVARQARLSSVRFDTYQPLVLAALFSDATHELPGIWDTFVAAVASYRPTRLALTGIGLHNLSDLSDVASLQQLRLLNTSVTDLSTLSRLPLLRSLTLNGKSVKDVSSLTGLNDLTGLDLRGTAVSDLGPLAGLTNLQWLDVGGTQIADMKPLSGMQRLQGLLFSDTKVKDLRPLANLHGLRWLDLQRTGVEDLTPLSGMTVLQVLQFAGTAVTDLTPLAGLRRLERVLLDDTSVVDLSALAELPKLREITLLRTPVSAEEISRLQSLRQQHDYPLVAVLR